MAEMKRFRSALNGFNREDVVAYVEYINNQHNAQIKQLSAQLQETRSLQDTSDLQNRLEDANARLEELQKQLTDALEKCAQLEKQLAARQETPSPEVSELEAYRRAERTERLAKERASQIFAQANAVLADAAVQAEAAANSMGVIADQAAAQLKQCQESVQATKEAFRQTVQALYAIRPEEV